MTIDYSDSFSTLDSPIRDSSDLESKPLVERTDDKDADFVELIPMVTPRKAAVLYILCAVVILFATTNIFSSVLVGHRAMDVQEYNGIADQLPMPNPSAGLP